MERIIIGICIAFVVVAALVVSATQGDAASWGQEFEDCLAAPAYQTALNDHGWDSAEELAAWYACVDVADAASSVDPVVPPQTGAGNAYSAGDTIATTTADANETNPDPHNAADYDYGTTTLSAWDAALLNCTFGIEPPEGGVTMTYEYWDPETGETSIENVKVTECSGPNGFW